ncbi:MAG: DNA mismatch repair endonuclease MutL [archaeon]|jgi:DNA mismatch repair protein MutL
MIKKLSQETINLISAGEVIEGPSDILKELIENSIDAGAKSIVIKLKNCGIDLIEIKDDGSGISKEDLEVCTQRHTTSKLEKIDDLYSIATFGFRGEALSSINSISKMEIISTDNDAGQGYILRNGEIKSISSPRGTIIKIEDLFYNVPVRKKFLKSKTFELAKANNTILEFVIQYPEIRFQIFSDKKEDTYPKTTPENRYSQVFGKDILSKVNTIDQKSEILKIRGIIAKPKHYFFYPSNFLYINKRPVISTQVNKIIINSYKDYLMTHQKPFFVLFIELDSKTIDVNIHPKKRFVKIQNEFLFNSGLKEIINSVLFSNTKETVVSEDNRQITDFLGNSFNVEYPVSSNNLNSPNQLDYLIKENSDIKNELKNKDIFYFTNKTEEIRKVVLDAHEINEIAGQVFDTFIVCKTPDGLLLIDQHAAEERINLEKNRLAYSSEFKIQNLVIPQKLDFISDIQKEFILINKKLLADLGFTIELKRERLYLITIPEFLEHYFDYKFFLELLQNIEESNNFDIAKIKDKILKLKSCKESIKANAPLSISQIYNLIVNLDKCQDKGICAHGRPTYILINKKELNKMFKRII